MTDLPPPPGSPPPPPPPGGGGFPPPPPPGGQPPPPGGWAQPAGGAAVESANFGQRLVALILDGLILGLPLGIIFQIVLSQVPTEFVVCSEGICEQPTSGGWAILVIVWLAQLAVSLWYWAELEGRRGQTLGKKVMSIKTVDAVSLQPIGAGRAVGRYFSRILSTIPCLLGYLWMLWDDKNQTWHDKIVTSVVVKA